MSASRLILSSIIVLFGLIFIRSAANAEDRADFGKCSEAEWEYIQDSGISTEKVSRLRQAGITLDEYFEYPWLRYSISEEEWIRQRASKILKAENEYLEASVAQQDWIIVHSLLLPGYYQLKSNLQKGYVMSGAAILSLLLFVFHDSGNDQNSFGFEYPQYLLTLGGSMLWSSIDMGYETQKKQQCKTRGFTFDVYKQLGNQLSLTYSRRGNVVSYVQNVSP